MLFSASSCLAKRIVLKLTLTNTNACYKNYKLIVNVNALPLFWKVLKFIKLQNIC